MPVTLTLKPRAKDTWHDVPVVINALDSISKDLSMIKAAMWITLAARIQTQAEDMMPDGKLAPVEIQLSNTEARLLWKNIIKLTPDKFGRNQRTGEPAAPHYGVLSNMLVDFAQQLGETFPESAGGEDDG